LTLLLLAAAPVSVPAPTDPLTPLYILVGTAVVGQLAALVFGFVKWLGSRTVEREDRDKEKFEERLDAHDDRFKALEQSIANLDRAVLTMQSEVKQTHELVSSIRGAVAEIKIGLDSRFEKQADFYRSALKDHVSNLSDQLEKLEYQIRQDMMRAIHDAQTLRGRKKT